MVVPVIRDRSNLSATSKKIEYISPEEMSVAIEAVVTNAIAIQSDLSVTYIAKMFGFSRVTEEMREVILERIDDVVKSDRIKREDNVLRPIEKTVVN